MMPRRGAVCWIGRWYGYWYGYNAGGVLIGVEERREEEGRGVEIGVAIEGLIGMRVYLYWIVQCIAV